MIAVEIDIVDSWQGDTKWEELTQEAVNAAAAQTPYAPLASCTLQCSVSIILTDDDEVHALNRKYRQKDRPTNVLSFPMMDTPQLSALTSRSGGQAMLGDIAVAYGTCAKEAAEKGIALAQHSAHLIVHGMLHLLGYDHIEDAQADAMEALEIKALASMGLPNPYTAG